MTMTCERSEALLPLAVGGDLDARDQGHVEAHLAGCARCSALAEEQRASQRWLKAEATPEIGGAVYDELRRSIRQRIADQRPAPALLGFLGRHWQWYRRFRPFATNQTMLAGVASMALVVGTLALVWPRDGGDLPGVTMAPELATAQPTARPGSAGSHGRAADSTALLAQSGEVDGTLLSDDDEVSADSSMRIEIQTQDPSVRIIWLARAEN
jgi:anti-sigma factor RsiW